MKDTSRQVTRKKDLTATLSAISGNTLLLIMKLEHFQDDVLRDCWQVGLP